MKKPNAYTLKKMLFAGVMMLLFLPLVQWKLKLVPVEELNGAIVKKEKVWFNKENWLSLKYQDSAEAWFNENFGFRNTCVRLRNQIDFSIFGKVTAREVVIGKDGYLFEKNYLLAYTGKDYIGKQSMDNRLFKLKMLQDTLQKLNITLMVVLAPGKASYYPEYIPDNYGAAAKTTNYTAMAEGLLRQQINHIDMNKWFMQMKATTQYPLFPKTGIHWSRYSTVLAIDSINRFIEAKRYIDMPGLKITKVALSRDYISPDDDLAKGMNLLFDPDGIDMGYPAAVFEDTSGKTRPNMISVSDSYFMALFDQDLVPNFYRHVDFWYYNQEIFHDSLAAKSHVADASLPDELLKTNVLMILGTEANLSGLSWGYINEAYDYFYASKSLSEYDKKVKFWETKIIKEKEWFLDVQKKAVERSIPVDSMIKLDAMWMVEDEMRKSAQKK